MDDLSSAQISRVLERKRVLLRALLNERHLSAYQFVNVRLTNVYDWTERLIMAVKKTGKKAPDKADFVGFFNYEMKAEEKEVCREWVRHEEEVALAIEDAVASRYKLTISQDTRSGGYQATMQAYDPKDKNAGLCMSAYAKHWYDALGVLMFKHTQVLRKDWKSVEESPDESDFG